MLIRPEQQNVPGAQFITPREMPFGILENRARMRSLRIVADVYNWLRTMGPLHHRKAIRSEMAQKPVLAMPIPQRGVDRR